MTSAQPSGESLGRMRGLDVRILAAIAAAVMLIVGVMWVVPTTPNSKSFTFNGSRRGVSAARPVQPGSTVEGRIVDGSDVDFYRLGPLATGAVLDVRIANGSRSMIPGLIVFDSAANLIQERTSEFLRRPGSNIESFFSAEPNTTYYLQVMTQRNTTGPYTLTITLRQP